MRKHQIRQIQGILRTLAEAHNELLKQASQDVCAALLADCQEGALAVGDYINKLVGDGTETVSLIEEYADMVYAASQSKAESGDIDLLKKQLKRIDTKIKTELKADRIEAAFFPYQLSMWDSLESICLAAKADPNCDAYCVPIPWFEKLPNGRLGKMRFDGDQYPADTEVTDWQSYDVEARHPDVIFIHSPYDEANFVTSVHPDYYSKRLRACTDLLCYVPYFVCADDNVEEIFCTAAGCIYAHKVILESEQVRDTYIRVFNKAFGNGFGNPRSKFIALGSPKYDRAISLRREDRELPKAWNKLIMKADGSKKKAVLYNTSIAGILKYNERYLIKLRSVLDAFKGRDDVVLWWRPHPLSEQTYKNMKPMIAQAYKAIVNDYKRENFGIYDDTHYLYRAIASSDVYYGDASSVTLLYEASGKRRYISGFFPECERYLGASEFFFMTMFVHDNALFSLILDRNLILRTDLITAKSSRFGTVPGKSILNNRLYHHTKVMDDKVIFIPFCNDDIAIYDFCKDAYTLHKLRLEQKYMLAGEGNFFNVCVYGNKLFLIPFAYRSIVEYDLESNESRHCLDLSELFPVNEDNLMFHQYAHLDDSTILLPSLRSNKLLEFHLDTYEYKLHRIGNKGYRLNSIHGYNGAFWIVCLNKLKILKWNYKTNTVTEYGDFPRGCTTRNAERAYFNVRGIFRYKNKLICLPAYCNMAVEFNMDTGLISKIDAFDLCFKTAPVYDDVSLTDTGLRHGSKIYFFYGNRKVFCFDIEKDAVNEICDVPPDLTDTDIQKINNDFIDAMLFDEDFDESNRISATPPDGQAGQRIYDYVKKQLNPG